MPKSKRYSRMRSRRPFKKRSFKKSIKKNVYTWNKMNAKVERVARMIPQAEVKVIKTIYAFNMNGAGRGGAVSAFQFPNNFAGPAPPLDLFTIAVPQGVQQGQRLGNKIFVKHLVLKWNYTMEPIDPDVAPEVDLNQTAVRVVCYQLRNSADDVSGAFGLASADLVHDPVYFNWSDINAAAFDLKMVKPLDDVRQTCINAASFTVTRNHTYTHYINDAVEFLNNNISNLYLAGMRNGFAVKIMSQIPTQYRLRFNMSATLSFTDL